MLDYAPVLRERGLTLLVEKLLSIDVEIRIEDEEDETDENGVGNRQRSNERNPYLRNWTSCSTSRSIT